MSIRIADGWLLELFAKGRSNTFDASWGRRIIRIRIADGWFAEASPIFAVYPPQGQLAPKVRALLDFLVDRFGAPVGGKAPHIPAN